jgi:hypothetical protein
MSKGVRSLLQGFGLAIASAATIVAGPWLLDRLLDLMVGISRFMEGLPPVIAIAFVVIVTGVLFSVVLYATEDQNNVA